MKQLIRKIVYYSSQEVGNTVLWEAPRGSTNVGQEAKEKEKLGKSIYGGLTGSNG